MDDIKKLEKARDLIESVTIEDLRENIIWLRQARCSLGYIKDAVNNLKKQ